MLAKDAAIRPKPTSEKVTYATMQNSRISWTSNSSEATLAASTKQATHNLRKLYQALGLLMPQRQRHAYIAYSIILNFTVTLCFPAAFGLSYWRLLRTQMSRAEFNTFLNSLQLYFNVLSCKIRIVMSTRTRANWSATDKFVERLDRRCRQSPQEIDQLRLCGRFCNGVVVFYVVFYIVYSICTFVGALLKGQPPYNVYLPFVDWRRSRLELLIASVIELLLICVTVSQQAFNDTFALVYTFILWTHMKILLLRFGQLGKAGSALSSEENLAELKRCIQDHKNYLEFYEGITPIITASMFVNFLIIAISLSTALVNIVFIGTDLNSRVGSFIYIAAVFSQVIPVSYIAQCLMDESNRLAEVIFHSDWIGQDARYRKLLVFLMQRTQATKYMMAGKLFPINLSSSLNIVKFAFSLYTFITTMDLQNQFGE